MDIIVKEVSNFEEQLLESEKKLTADHPFKKRMLVTENINLIFKDSHVLSDNRINIKSTPMNIFTLLRNCIP